MQNSQVSSHAVAMIHMLEQLSPHLDHEDLARIGTQIGNGIEQINTGCHGITLTRPRWQDR
jgi:hypothetical protein